MNVNDVAAPFCLTLNYAQVHNLERFVKKVGNDDLQHQFIRQRHLWQARLQQRINTLRNEGNMPAVASTDDEPPHPCD